MANSDIKQQILDAAGPIFARSGFRGATVREICAAADVNVASVNYYFGDKSQLYVEVVRLAHQVRAQTIPMPEWPAHADSKEKLYGFVHTILQRMIGSDGESWPVQLMVREVIKPTDACRALVKEYFRPNFEVLLEILSELLPATTTAEKKQQVALSVFGQCFLYRVAGDVLPMIIGKKTMRESFQVEQLAEHIAGFTCAAIDNLSDEWRQPMNPINDLPANHQ